MKKHVLVALLLCASSVAFADVKLVNVTAAQSTNREVVTGQLGPSKMLPLGFEVGGRLLVSKALKGEVVKAGQLLGQLDTEIIDAQVAQAEAGLAAAEAGSGLATDVAERNEKLKGEGGVSDVQSKQTSTQAKAAQAQVMGAKAGLAQARAGQRKHYLRAPFSGTIVEAPDNAGGMVGPGTPVYILMQLSPLVLKATIAEASRGQVKPGLKVKVESVGSTQVTSDATVKVVIPVADPQTRRIPVEILVPNDNLQFVANTLAKLTLPLGESRAAITIPNTALGSTGGDHIFTVSEGKLKRIAVSVVERKQNTMTVLCSENVAQVVDYPTDSLKDGAKQ
jgi:membrane fusion protein, multidrug efflux system